MNASAIKFAFRAHDFVRLTASRPTSLCRFTHPCTVRAVATASSAAAQGQNSENARPSDAYIANENVRHKKMIDEMIRVDQAGEIAAVKIYEGQMWVLKGTPVYPTIVKMRDGEIDHLNTMNRLVAERRARPTVAMPLAELGGFLLGASTALLGKEAAMACTVAVETVIGDHYNDQIRQLLKAGYSETELAGIFKRHRDEELEHLDIAKVNDAEKAPLYNALSQAIKLGCQAAIWVAKRV